MSGPTARALVGVDLPALPAGGHAPAGLERLAAALRPPPDVWRTLGSSLAFDARQYRRVRLFRGPEWEGILLCWLPGQATALHDHAESAGLSLILMGCLRERRWESQGAGRPLRLAEERDVAAPAFTIEHQQTIHEVANESTLPAASLHLYSPPLRCLGAHAAATGRRWVVDVADSPSVQVGGDPSLLI